MPLSDDLDRDLVNTRRYRAQVDVARARVARALERPHFGAGLKQVNPKGHGTARASSGDGAHLATRWEYPVE